MKCKKIWIAQNPYKKDECLASFQDRSGDGHFFDGPENHQYVPYREYVVFEVEEEQ